MRGHRVWKRKNGECSVGSACSALLIVASDRRRNRFLAVVGGE